MPFPVVPARDRLLNRLVKRAPVEVVDRGETVVRAGQAAREAVLVREGHLEAREPDETPSGDADGAGTGVAGARVVDLVLPWELAGMDALLEGAVHRWSLVAAEPARIQRLDGRAVRGVLRRAEGTFDAFHGASRDRLALLRALTGGSGAPAAWRLWRVLVHLARRSGEGSGGLELPVRVTHRVLGEMAGLHRSTVTTLLNDWLYRDLLESMEPGWGIPDPAAMDVDPAVR